MRIALLIGLLLAAGNVAAADIWASLHGCWSGGGEVSGMPAAIELEFRPALEGRGHHLRFGNRMTMRDGKVWSFRAEAIYLCADDGSCRGHWYDNRGMVLPLATTAHDDHLVVEWGDDAGERGRTTYRIVDGGLGITDEVRGKDGAWKPFGSTNAIRVRAGASP